jgi:hypothetical protein
MDQKDEAWLSDYGHINEVPLEGHWEAFRKFDPELPEVVPDDPEVLKRALLGMGRLIAQFEHEWGLEVG